MNKTQRLFGLLAGLTLVVSACSAGSSPSPSSPGSSQPVSSQPAGSSTEPSAAALPEGDFKITLWTYVEPVRRVLPPAEYAQALGRLHAGLRRIDVEGPHVMDRVAATQHDVASHDVTPDLAATDRAHLLRPGVQ